MLKIWDTRAPISQSTTGSPAAAALSMQAHPTEVLSLDWNKYQPHLIATGSVDRTVRIHDLRMATQSVSQHAPGGMVNATVANLLGHEYAVRRVAWSPHSANVLVSGSYDMTARVWSLDAAGLGQAQASSFGPAGMGGARMEKVYDGHTEFVVGAAWSLYEEGLLATCSWDQEVHLWR